MTMFTDNAKNYIQLSGAALVLSVTFIHEVLGIRAGDRISVDGWMIAAWIAFLFAILSGAFYQYLAAHSSPGVRPASNCCFSIG